MYHYRMHSSWSHVDHPQPVLQPALTRIKPMHAVVSNPLDVDVFTRHTNMQLYFFTHVCVCLTLSDYTLAHAERHTLYSSVNHKEQQMCKSVPYNTDMAQ
eukprot:m.96220 g.96220  ORF g.96220 m.96220 type:complete len:100 (-) comp13070_c0_seq1:1586-1885(-)